ncbi:Uncharacterised protein [Mycobacteroides abscessus subsp. abscessus]|nr:Uncharacterised protein [Mycobacteroides abscessus subsp. abscessus]
MATLAAPPSNRRYWRVEMPPIEWPTMSTLAAPVDASTLSTKVLIWVADFTMSPVPYTPGNAAATPPP